MLREKSSTRKQKKLQATDRLLARLDGYSGLINLLGNYDYLSTAYYLSQDLEAAGVEVYPTCKEMLDAYVPPLFLEKAASAGIPVPHNYISNGYIEPPVIVDPVNPFTLKGRVITKQGSVKHATKSLTRNFTYAICCQEIPPGGRVAYFRSVLGWSTQKNFRDLSQLVWDLFHIPLARVRVIRTVDGEALLSDISPLFFEDLKEREIRFLEEHVTWEC